MVGIASGMAHSLTSAFSSPPLPNLGPWPAHTGTGSRDRSPVQPYHHPYSTWQGPGFGRHAGLTSFTSQYWD